MVLVPKQRYRPMEQNRGLRGTHNRHMLVTIQQCIKINYILKDIIYLSSLSHCVWKVGLDSTQLSHYQGPLWRNQMVCRCRGKRESSQSLKMC